MVLGDPAVLEAKLLGGDELGDQPAIEGGEVGLAFDMGEKAQPDGVGHGDVPLRPAKRCAGSIYLVGYTGAPGGALKLTGPTPPVWSAPLPSAMGRSQVVRQRILIPPFPGSNPGAPATQFCYFGASGDLPENPDITCVSSRRFGLWRPLIRIFEPKNVSFGRQSQFESLQFPFLHRAADLRLICSTLRPGSTMALLA
jgi:hypothetical protein